MLYKWRKEMGVGYAESMATPQQVIEEDLMFMELESQYLAPKPDVSDNNKRNG